MAGATDVGHAAEAWLCLLPADARRFRVGDDLLAAALRIGGAELVDSAPDAEIVLSPGALRGDARTAVVSLGRPGWARGSVPARVAKRSSASARVRTQALMARRALRRHGYERTDAVSWDLGHAFRRDGTPPARSAVERLPQCALVFGRRDSGVASVLDVVLEEAGEAIGTALAPRRLAAGGGMLLAFCEQHLVRVAMGPARCQIEAHQAALGALCATHPANEVATRVPWPGARGETGLARWSVEPLLPGAPPELPLPDGVVAECADFLAALFSVTGSAEPRARLTEAAAIVGSVCGEAERTMVGGIGDWLDASLADVPRGFGHGDFFPGNLLVDGGRLVGVVDWDSAGPGRLPLVDLLHLVLTSTGRAVDLDWGRDLVGELLPLARRGGNEQVRGYCDRVGLEPDPLLLELLVIAYWLDRAASQLSTHAEHRDDPDWIDSNIVLVARSLPEAWPGHS